VRQDTVSVIASSATCAFTRLVARQENCPRNVETAFVSSTVYDHLFVHLIHHHCLCAHARSALGHKYKVAADFHCPHFALLYLQMSIKMIVERNLSYGALAGDSEENKCLILLPLQSELLLLAMCVGDDDLKKIAPLFVLGINGGESVEEISEALARECISESKMFNQLRNVVMSKNFLLVADRHKVSDLLLDNLKGSGLDFSHDSYTGPDDELFLARFNAMSAILTNERIRATLNAGLLQKAAILLNLLHVKVAWLSPMVKIGMSKFQRYKPSESDAGSCGCEEFREFMSITAKFKQASNALVDCSAIELPLASDEGITGYRMSMIIVVPSDAVAFSNAVRCLSQQDKLDRLLDKFQDPANERVLCKVSMPLFSIESNVNVSDYVEQLKDLSFNNKGLVGPISTENGVFVPNVLAALKVDNIVQRSFVEVNEKGCEAAAATYATVADGPARNTPNHFQVERPFLFLWTQTNVETSVRRIISIGKIGNPIWHHIETADCGTIEAVTVSTFPAAEDDSTLPIILTKL
jgi:Serpin (serine protease inhibitor)